MIQAIGVNVQDKKGVVLPKKSMSFGTRASDNYYENPIDRHTERGLAILSSSAWSALVGLAAGYITHTIAKESSWKLPVGVGAGFAALTMLLTLPGKLYNTKVKAFAREKEMDVFSRQKETQADLYDDLNTEINNVYVPLDQKINHYSTVKMADNGNGVMIKGVQ